MSVILCADAGTVQQAQALEAILRSTMSRENVEVVRRYVESLNDRDLSHLSELLDSGLLDPDIELDLSRNVFNPDVYRGRAGLERWRSAVEEIWDDFHGIIDEIVDAGDKVVVSVTIKGKGRESGVDVSMRVFQVVTVRDSRIVRVVGGYRDRAETLEAAGLREKPAIDN